MEIQSRCGLAILPWGMEYSIVHVVTAWTLRWERMPKIEDFWKQFLVPLSRVDSINSR